MAKHYNPFVPPNGEESESLPLSGDGSKLYIFVRQNGDKTYAKSPIDGDVSLSLQDEIHRGKLRSKDIYVVDTERRVFARPDSHGGSKRIERE